MANCEFLYKEEKKTCAGCRGWFCTAMGSKKKLGDIRECTTQWDDCPRYLKVYPKPIEERETVSTDDYVELPPTEEVTSISGVDTETITVTVKPEPKTKKVVPKKKVVAPVAYTIITPRPPGDCPYLGPVPPGKYGCCGYWCYAKEDPLRSVKRCKSPPSWRECRRRYDAERAGVKHSSA